MGTEKIHINLTDIEAGMVAEHPCCEVYVVGDGRSYLKTDEELLSELMYNIDKLRARLQAAGRKEFQWKE